MSWLIVFILDFCFALLNFAPAADATHAAHYGISALLTVAEL